MAFRYAGDGWRVSDCLRTFGDQIMEARGHTNSYTVDGTLGDASHSSRVSDHNPDENGIVRALDFYEWQPGVADQIGEALRESRDNRIKYFIHDRRMFSSYPTFQYSAWTWRPYTGPNPHSTHGHLSTTTLGDSDPSPFTIGDDMPTPSEIAEAVWLDTTIPDQDNPGQRTHMSDAVKQVWVDALAARKAAERAAADAAIARALAEQAAAAPRVGLSEAQVRAIIAGSSIVPGD